MNKFVTSVSWLKCFRVVFFSCVAYDDRQKAKRDTIISRPLFSSSNEQLAPTPASATQSSSSSASSSSSSTKSVSDRHREATLSRIRQITSAHQPNPFRSRSAAAANNCRLKLSAVDSKSSVFGIRRLSDDHASEAKLIAKRQRLSDAGDRSSCVVSDAESGDIAHMDMTSQRRNSTGAPVANDPQSAATALTLVSSYNSSSSSVGDSD